MHKEMNRMTRELSKLGGVPKGSAATDGWASLLARASVILATKGQQGRALFAQCILVDPAVLHDDEQVFIRIRATRNSARIVS
jgi:hypothetical protein